MHGCARDPHLPPTSRVYPPSAVEYQAASAVADATGGGFQGDDTSISSSHGRLGTLLSGLSSSVLHWLGLAGPPSSWPLSPSSSSSSSSAAAAATVPAAAAYPGGYIPSWGSGGRVTQMGGLWDRCGADRSPKLRGCVKTILVAGLV